MQLAFLVVSGSLMKHSLASQIIDTKRIKPSSGSGADRYRLVLSDGSSYISGMLATQLAFVRSWQLTEEEAVA